MYPAIQNGHNESSAYGSSAITPFFEYLFEKII
jgi:hypothetical protein